MTIMEKLLTPEEVAEIFKIDKRTVYYWIEKRTIPYIRINKKVIRFRPVDVDEFIQRHFVKASDVDEIVDEILSKIS